MRVVGLMLLCLVGFGVANGCRDGSCTLGDIEVCRSTEREATVFGLLMLAQQLAPNCYETRGIQLTVGTSHGPYAPNTQDACFLVTTDGSKALYVTTVGADSAAVEFDSPGPARIIADDPVIAIPTSGPARFRVSSLASMLTVMIN